MDITERSFILIIVGVKGLCYKCSFFCGRLVVAASCRMYLQKFPTDVQKCSLVLESCKCGWVSYFYLGFLCLILCAEYRLNLQ